MKEITEDEIKQIQLEILSDISSYCNENNLRYHLTFGTLLGAIRHKGYIPWDDDVDIAMPRPDYEKFMKEYVSRTNRFIAVSELNNKNHYYTFGKVIDTQTVLNELHSRRNNYGVYIDVFPIDGVRNLSLSVFLMSSIQRIINAKNVVTNDRSFGKNVFANVVRFLTSFLDIRLFVTLSNKLAKMCSYDDCEYVGFLCSDAPSQEGILKRELVECLIDWPFEGRIFKVPRYYDEYLTHLYGDYLQLPPEEKRIGQHAVKVFYKDTNTSCI